MKFAYADPPYFKQGKKHYGKLHDEADIWDGKQAHWDLIDRLMAELLAAIQLICLGSSNMREFAFVHGLRHFIKFDMCLFNMLGKQF